MNILLLVATIILIPFAISWFSLAPWAPTRKKDVERAIDLMDFNWRRVFFELGAWDGRTCFEVAKRFNIEVIWIEINFFLYLICLIKKSLFYNDKKINFYNRNLFKIDLSSADIIYTFWMPEKMGKLGAKIKNECKIWTQVISYAFSIDGLENEIKDKPTPDVLSFFCYKV